MVVGFSYCLGTSTTYTAQGYLQCTYGRRAILFRHEQYGERSSTDQLPKHWKILDRLCYQKYRAEVEANEEADVNPNRTEFRPFDRYFIQTGQDANPNRTEFCPFNMYFIHTGRDSTQMSTQCFIIVALELSKGANSLQAEEQDIPPPTITAMKIPIIRKGEYDIWSMRMRQYICHTDHNLWDVIVNGDLEEEPAPTGDQSGPSAPPAPKTAKQLAARRNQERVKSILLLAIPDEYLLKFHNVADAKSL
ncbi:hypothetical protein Tco_0705868 [Tanacetum coccineum]|uniref:Uncharacterized protein n=1 Tax=Tanacetum coccineum TaxID=301880 RepID=A0ABQ4Y7A8_9ASTR